MRNLGQEILVSVILPIYNAERYLERCLKSICQQTLREIEIVAINDGSTDNSMRILKSFAEEDSRIVIIDQPNGGVSKARNVGIDKASGKYIAFVDADDWIQSNMVEALYNASITTGAAITKCDALFEGNNSEKMDYKSNSYRMYNAIDCLNELFTEYEETHFGYVWSKLFLKSFLDEYALRFEEDMNLAEDVVFLTKALVKCEKICYVPMQLYHYNIATESSLTRGKVQNLYGKYELLYNRLLDVLIHENMYTQVENSFINYQFEGLMVVTHGKNGYIGNRNQLLRDLKTEIENFTKKYPKLRSFKPINKNKKVTIRKITKTPFLYSLIVSHLRKFKKE